MADLKISDIATTETDVANVSWMEGERADGSPVRLDPALLASGGGSGGGGVTTTGRYWMLTNQTASDKDVYLGFAEIQFRTSVGGAAVAVSAVEAFNGELGAAANAIDGNNGTFWAPNTARDQTWFIADLGSSQTIEELAIISRNDGFFGRTSRIFHLSCSEDGVTYNHVGVIDMGIFTGNSETRTATLPEPVAAGGGGAAATGVTAADWRFLVTGAAAGESFIAIGEILGLDSTGAVVGLSAGVLSRSSAFDTAWEAVEAFDGVRGVDNGWSSTGEQVGAWIRTKLEFDVTVQRIGFAVVANWAAQLPSEITVQTSDDNGATWTTVKVCTLVTRTALDYQMFDITT